MMYRFQRLALLTLLTVCVTATSARSADKDIVDTAVGAGSFKTLAAALQAADLVSALQGDGPFTVFAPTDDAFAKLPAGTVESLLKPENKAKLVSILTYHVVSGSVPAAKVVSLSGATTLNGQRVDIKVTDGKVTVDDANVVTTDIECSNGIIHVIDQVILPASDDLATTAIRAGSFNTLVAAAKAAGLITALFGEDPLTIFAPTDAAFGKLPEGTVASLLKDENRARLTSILKYHIVPGRIYSNNALSAGSAKTLQGESVRVAVVDGVAKVNDSVLISTDLDASNGVIHIIDAVLLPPERTQTATSARRMIVSAINHGAPLYNAGHVAQCASTYMSTVMTLLDAEGQDMPPATRRMLEAAMHSCQQTSCSTTQAWTLRHAMDYAYRTMPEIR